MPKPPRCEVTHPESGEQCLFSGPHGDHIARGPDGKMWTTSAKTELGEWRHLNG